MLADDVLILKDPAPAIGFGAPLTAVQFAVDPSVELDSNTNPAAEAGHAIAAMLPAPTVAVSVGCSA